jgi:hypothetical protein
MPAIADRAIATAEVQPNLTKFDFIRMLPVD